MSRTLSRRPGRQAQPAARPERLPRHEADPAVTNRRQGRIHTGETGGHDIDGSRRLHVCQPTPVDSNDLTDEQAVALALDDRHHFGLLYERYADRLYWYASVRTGSASAADDVVSDTMVTVLENLESFDRGRGTFASWLFAIAHRKVVDHHRYHQRLRRFITRNGRRLELQEEEDALERVLRGERSGELHRALAKLRPEDQDLIALRYSAELPSAEVAAVIGTTPETARKRLSRAMERLHDQLDRERQAG